MNPIDVRDLLGHPGSSRAVRVDEPVPGLGIELARVPDETPVHGEFLLESVVEGILVSGTVGGRMALSCARCLRTFDAGFEFQVRELFSADAPPGGDEYPLQPEGAIDVEPMVRDALMLGLPFSPLCRHDCLGLCERCGGDRNAGECTCAPQPADARWAWLDRLFN
ncbi:MAG: DUF177 domain-containing protein [Actinomycetota bacterium]|nr:DUF177 domain-containing protein [Actinomycetota bacterium]